MGVVLRLWSSLGDVLKYAIGFTVLILLSGNVIALVMKKATIVLYIVIVLFYYLTTTVRILYRLFQMGGGDSCPK